MRLTRKRNLATGAAPDFAGRILILGDVPAPAGAGGALAGGVLEQLDESATYGGAVKLGHVGHADYRLLGHDGARRFLNFADLSDAPGMVAAQAAMAALGSFQAAVIVLGGNDLAHVEPATGAVPGYDGPKIVQGLTRLVSEIHRRNQAHNPALPVVLAVPGRVRDHDKRGGAQTWRRAVVTFAAADAQVRLVDSYDLAPAEGAYRDPASDRVLGMRIARLLAAPPVGGPPVIRRIDRQGPKRLRVTIDIPPGETLTQPGWPAGWRAFDAVTGAALRIARLHWTAPNICELVLHDAARGGIRLAAPHDIVEEFSMRGFIGARAGGDGRWPGFALQGFEGVAP